MAVRGIRKFSSVLQAAVVLLLAGSLQGCLVSKAVGATVGVAAGTVKAGVGVTGAVAGGVVDVVVPDSEDKED